MKQISKVLGMFVAMMSMATSVWAGGEVTVIKQLNGTENNAAGTVVASEPVDGVVTLTVTPAEGNYITVDFITAERTIDGGLAQARFRAPDMANGITVENLGDNADPSIETTYQFTMPEDNTYDVEVVANFQSRISIADAVVTLAETTVTYNGQAQTPAVSSVKVGDNTLTAETDYTVSYSNNTDAGTATVTLTGQRTYIGETTANFEISKALLSNLSVTIEGWTYGEYDEEMNAPSIEGNDGEGDESIFYKVTGAADDTYTATVPTNAGNYTVKVSVVATDNYEAGEATAEFTIAKADLQIAVEISDWTYGDAPNAPTVGDSNLGGGTVTYTYGDGDSEEANYGTTVPTAAGSYFVKAEVAETDNYNGASDITPFTIAQADFSEVVIADIAAQTFTGEAITPAVTVTFKGNPVDASEFTATYSNNTNVGEATVTLTTKDVNFAESEINPNPSKTFQIVAAAATITGEDQAVTYNGVAQMFTSYQVTAGSVVVTYYASEAERDKGSNGTVTVPTAAATYYVQLTQGDANYTSEPVNVTFTINPKQLTDDMLWNEGTEFAYNDQPVELEESMFGLTDKILDEEIELEAGEDFTVEYTNNDKVGTATVTLTGQGNYTGTVTFDFELVRELNLMFGTENSGEWATYFAAENLNVPEQLEAYIVTEVSGTTVSVSEITYIPQGVAVLLKKLEEYDGLTATAYTGEIGDFTDNILQGCATPTSVSGLTVDNDIYVLYNDEFVKTTKGTIPANRCYLPVAKNSGAEARLSIFIDNEDTGIAVIETMRNVANEKFYNLSGQRVMTPAKGLYIVNGKKVVLK